MEKIKNKKKKLRAVLIFIGVALLTVIVGFAANELKKNGGEKTLSFRELPGVEAEPQFVMLSLSRRVSEDGSALHLMNLTSEEDRALLTGAVKIIEDYRFLPWEGVAAAPDFVAANFVYSENSVLRLEVYSDSSVLLIASEDGGIYKAYPPEGSEKGMYTALYEYMAARK